jgi:hypothetical protein
MSQTKISPERSIEERILSEFVDLANSIHSIADSLESIVGLLEGVISKPIDEGRAHIRVYDQGRD